MRYIKLFEAFKFDLLYGGMFSKYTSDNFTLMGGQRVQGGLNINGINYYRLRYSIYSHEILKEVNDQEDAIVGTIDLGRDDDGSPVGVLDLKFKPKFRGRGFGKLLVKELVESTKDGLTVLDIQKKAIKFWEKCGAKIEKTKYATLTGIIPKTINEAIAGYPLPLAPYNIFMRYFKCDCKEASCAPFFIKYCPDCHQLTKEINEKEYLQIMKSAIPPDEWNNFLSHYKHAKEDGIVPFDDLNRGGEQTEYNDNDPKIDPKSNKEDYYTEIN